MTASSYRETAQIIQFPAGGRASFSLRHDGRKSAEHPVLQAAKTIGGGAWYHEQAIQDAARVGKN
jgi:hypothetical protein